MAFSVIILASDIDRLVACIESLYQHERTLGPEQVVIVGRGLEWTPEALELLDGARIIPGREPLWSAANCNRGIRATLPQIDVTCMQDRDSQFISGPPTRDVILVNGDGMTLESDGGFSMLESEVARHPDYGIITASTNAPGEFVCTLIPARTLRGFGLLDEAAEAAEYVETVMRAGLEIGTCEACHVHMHVDLARRIGRIIYQLAERLSL